MSICSIHHIPLNSLFTFPPEIWYLQSSALLPGPAVGIASAVDHHHQSQLPLHCQSLWPKWWPCRACDINLGCVWWLTWKYDGWVWLGVGVNTSGPLKNGTWVDWSSWIFMFFFRIRGIDYGLVVCPIKDASQRIYNIFIFAVQEEVEHVQVFACQELKSPLLP